MADTWMKPNKGIPNSGRDERQFKQGEIWSANDQCVSIPDSEITGRTLHGIRPVVILSEYVDNCNPDYPLLLVAPICSKRSSDDLKELSDVEVCPEDGVRADSFVKVGLIQPFLKVYLQRKLGELTVDALDRVLATLDVITGAELPESAREEMTADETAAGLNSGKPTFEH